MAIGDRIGVADKDTQNKINTNTEINNSGSATGTLSQKLTHIISSLIGSTSATGGSATTGTIMSKLNALLASWTSTRAGYLDNIRSYTITNNTASKTGVLSQKESYTHSLLENSTYGLNAIYNKLVNNNSVIKSIQRGYIITPTTNHLEDNTSIYYVDITISSVKPEKSIIILDYIGPLIEEETSSTFEPRGNWGDIINSTTLRIYTNNGYYDERRRIDSGWQVIEFY